VNQFIHDVCRRRGGCLPELGAGPQAGALWIAACGCPGQHWTREVKDVGKAGDGLVVVLVDKPVAQSTGISSSERASNGGLGESRIGQRGAMNGFGPGLVGEQERRPELSGDGAGLKHMVEIGGGSQPTCGDDGQLATAGDRGQQIFQGLCGGRRKPVEDEAVSAGLRPLGDQGIEPTVSCGQCFIPIDGLYLGGAGCHGGPGITSIPGYNAAYQALEDISMMT